MLKRLMAFVSVMQGFGLTSQITAVPLVILIAQLVRETVHITVLHVQLGSSFSLTPTIATMSAQLGGLGTLFHEHALITRT